MGDVPVSSYAVLWRFGDGPVCAGRLELDDRVVALTGRSRSGEPSSANVDRRRISRLRIGRGRRDRIDGRPSLVLEDDAGKPLLIADAIGVGGILELADRLNASP